MSSKTIIQKYTYVVTVYALTETRKFTGSVLLDNTPHAEANFAYECARSIKSVVGIVEFIIHIEHNNKIIPNTTRVGSVIDPVADPAKSSLEFNSGLTVCKQCYNNWYKHLSNISAYVSVNDPTDDPTDAPPVYAEPTNAPRS